MTAHAFEPAALGMHLPATQVENSVFLASASYESRSLGVATNLPSERRFRVGLVYANEEFLSGVAGDATRSNQAQLAALLKLRCDAVFQETGSWLDPSKQLRALKSLVVEAGKQVEHADQICVHVDATTFTRESLIVGCALFRRLTGPKVFRLLYATPEKHGEWLSRGFRDVRNIMGFAGYQVPGAPTILIVLSGFEPERITRVIDEHEPSSVLLGIGNPPTNDAFLQRNLAEQEIVLSRQDVQKFEFPANSVTKCVERLESLVKPNLSRGNVIIAPMSTKLSTVAAMIIAERYPAVQLTYCVPGEYNTEMYSQGVQSIFIEDI